MFGNAFFFSALSYILDTVQTAKVGYALRKLKASATKAINVRRAGDNATLDIGFDSSGNLDQTALLTFVGYENNFTYSEQFDNFNWNKGSTLSITPNTTTDPLGGATADTLNTISSVQNFLYQLYSSVAGIKTQSIYAKQGTNRYLWMYGGGPGNNYGALFDLQNGVVTTTNTTGTPTNLSNSITSVGNGWYRCSITYSPSAVIYQAFASTNNASPTYTLNNDITNGDTGNIYIWGAQLQNSGTLGTYQQTTATAWVRDANVAILYDQMGAYNQIQATGANQPQIVSNGVIHTRGSKPALLFDGNRFLSTSGFTSSGMFGAVPMTENIVAISTVVFDQDFFGYGTAIALGLRSIGGGNIGGNDWRSTVAGDINNSTVTLQTFTVVTNTWDGTTSTLFTQGTSRGTSTGAENTTVTELFVGQRSNNGTRAVGSLSEALLFTTSLSTTNRQLLERNQGAYYGITVA